MIREQAKYIIYAKICIILIINNISSGIPKGWIKWLIDLENEQNHTDLSDDYYVCFVVMNWFFCLNYN